MFFRYVRSLINRDKRLVRSPELVVLGIGNVGERYAKTRHNIGFDVLDSMVARFGSSFSYEKRFKADTSYVIVSGKSVMLVKPRTYVNLSGESISAVLSGYELGVDRVVVVVDDFHLPLGSIRIRKSGSHGGHNGLKSIIAGIGDKFKRIRVGIGPLPRESSVIDFVLGKFTEEEEIIKKNVIKYSVGALLALIEKGEEFAISRFNGKIN